MSTLELTPLSPTQVAHNFPAQLFLLCLSHVKPWANKRSEWSTDVGELTMGKHWQRIPKRSEGGSVSLFCCPRTSP